MAINVETLRKTITLGEGKKNARFANQLLALITAVFQSEYRPTDPSIDTQIDATSKSQSTVKSRTDWRMHGL